MKGRRQSEAMCECGRPAIAFVEFFQTVYTETAHNEQRSRFGFWTCDTCLCMWDEDEKHTDYNVYPIPHTKTIEMPDKTRYHPG